ncbi:DUF6670 family protein [Pimelobacter simplex]|uniref:DUF6670 family protein n=1 Tax=Nocardioides simplex TaxID=2045 RepID=UPI00214FC557|nr:DUF6670 family protein [Pimelobacter simplex]UUW88072.1 hypothetical protein M0M43_20340 [Pimelobacter simplex]UUW97576.1 hypothetical protein M0M48_08985 [Pimelobacter simplex]
MNLLRHAAPLLVPALLRTDRRLQASTEPFRRTDLFRPHPRSRTWAWTHLGVFLPDLPAPYRFLNTMTFIGATGTTCFDDDRIAAPDARDTAMVLSATAHGEQHHHAGYDAATECSFPQSGPLRWGEDLTVEVDLPRVRVAGRYAAFEADVELDVTDLASWFVRSPAYDHVSLLAPYRATVRHDATEHTFAGLGTVEYARSLSPQSLLRRPLPGWAKLPIEFFTYQIVNLDADTQLLLTDVSAHGVTACRLLHVRTRGGTAEVYDDVRFEVTAWDPEPRHDPAGRPMRVPLRMRWTVRDGAAEVLRMDAEVDAPYRYGHGTGYVSAFRHETTWRGAQRTGSGYVEWVDRRQDTAGSATHASLRDQSSAASSSVTTRDGSLTRSSS